MGEGRSPRFLFYVSGGWCVFVHYNREHREKRSSVARTLDIPFCFGHLLGVVLACLSGRSNRQLNIVFEKVGMRGLAEDTDLRGPSHLNDN